MASDDRDPSSEIIASPFSDDEIESLQNSYALWPADDAESLTISRLLATIKARNEECPHRPKAEAELRKRIEIEHERDEYKAKAEAMNPERDSLRVAR